MCLPINMDKSILMKPLKAPVKVHLEIDKECYGVCSICPNKGKSTNDIHVNEGLVKKVLDECYKNEVLSISIAGHDMLKASILSKLQDLHLNEYDFLFSLSTCVNEPDVGVKAVAEALSRTGIDSLELHIINSSSKTINWIAELIDELALKFAIDSFDYMSIMDEHFGFAHKKLLRLQSLSKVGLLNIVLTRSLKLHIKDYKHVNKISRAQPINIYPCLPLCTVRDYSLPVVESVCQAGLTWCAFDAQGRIYPCPMFRIMVGTISDGLAEVWSNRMRVFRESRCEAEICKDCESNGCCKGGCPALSLLSFKDPYRGDPILYLNNGNH